MHEVKIIRQISHQTTLSLLKKIAWIGHLFIVIFTASFFPIRTLFIYGYKGMDYAGFLTQVHLTLKLNGNIEK